MFWNISHIKNLPPLASKFYQRSAPVVAKELLGKGLFLSQNKNHFLVQIVEVEAYLGSEDPASHAFKGPTPRNQSMFLSGGACYVYLSYGLNFCMNVVTGAAGKGSAVLIRAAVPLLGLEKMAENRHISRPLTYKMLKNLLSGPGKLTQALGIDRNFDGLSFDQSTFKIVDLNHKIPKQLIGISPRVGISRAKREPLRFYVRQSEFLSRPDRTKTVGV
ncbi:MAG: DNA-3-methyladenine glycosylase [Proteobacteria bacterium]|nr:DNA-3-methyladenine glycosylase [Pseudomonadota bacterium]NBY18867.1 DNA-3-methyladenine glycosylase [bacterium]